jgi:hypothetical protein
MNFICEVCGQEHEVEVRGGGPTTDAEWIEAGYPIGMPTEGLCDECQNNYSYCMECNKPKLNDETVDLGSENHKEMATESGIYYETSRICLSCLPKDPKLLAKSGVDAQTIIKMPFYADMLERMNDPNYKPTEAEQGALDIIMGEIPAVDPDAKILPKILSMTFNDIRQILNARDHRQHRTIIKVLEKQLGHGVKLNALFINSQPLRTPSGEIKHTDINGYANIMIPLPEIPGVSNKKLKQLTFSMDTTMQQVLDKIRETAARPSFETNENIDRNIKQISLLVDDI